MNLQPLFQMSVERFEGIRVGPLTGAEGAEWMYWATGEGTVSGDEIKGTLRACNHPRHRPDDVNLPDVHGVITTDGGETVYFEMTGFGLPAGDRTREVVASITFRSAAERLARLNTTLAVARGSINEGGKGAIGRYQVYECVTTADDTTARRDAAHAFLRYFENPPDNRLDEVLTEDCVIHVAGPIGQSLPNGPAGARALQRVVSEFADSHWRFEDEIAAGDRVVLKTINESRHHGVWNGLNGDGRTVPFDVVWIFRFDGPRIAEVWRVANDMSRIRALGGKIVPA